MKIIFVNRFYWPETPATGQLLTDLAEGLAALGWQVTVITSAAHAGVPTRELRHGVAIERVAGTRWARHGTIGKAVDFGTFFLGALWRVLRNAKKGTTVVAMTDPPMLGVGVWLAARCRRAVLVHWIQDIYPEIAIELFGHRWLRVLRPLRNAAWRAADTCVTLGSDMAKSLTEARVRRDRLAIVPNWAPAGVASLARDPDTPLRREWGLAENFVVAYSGNLGRVHDLEAVLDLAAALETDPKISVILVGKGAQRQALEEAARTRALSNLTFLPPQPRERLGESLAVGDLHLVTLRPGCEDFVFPSKLYGIAAAGRPILFIGPTDCEVARCVSDNGLGLVAAREGFKELACAVRQLARDPAAYAQQVAACRRFAEKHTAPVAVQSWHELLAPLTSRPKPIRASPADLAG